MNSASIDVSVVLPVHNAERWLGESLGSVVATQGEWLEVVVVDDASDDRSMAICETFRIQDNRVRVVAADGRGIVAALNTGLAVARGTYIARMDADDITLPGRFEAQRHFLEDTLDVSVVGCQVELAGDSREGMREYVRWQNQLRTPQEHHRDLFIESPLCHPSVLMRADAIRDVHGYRHGTFPEDYDLWLRLDAAGHKLAKIETVGLQWRQHAEQLTGNDPRLTDGAFRELKLSYLASTLRAEPRDLCIWGAGQVGKRSARALESHDIRAARFVDVDSAKIGRQARGVPIGNADSLDRRKEFVLAAVGTRGARAQIREHLQARGWTETSDFTCIA